MSDENPEQVGGGKLYSKATGVGVFNDRTPDDMIISASIAAEVAMGRYKGCEGHTMKVSKSRKTDSGSMNVIFDPEIFKTKE